MNDLIDNIVTAFETAQTAGTLNTNKVFKGLHDIPQLAANTEFPYVMVDDGGERTELNDSMESQTRFYSVIIEIGTYSLENVTAALDQILDITTELKDVIELEANRFKDGLVWGITITPFGWDKSDSFFRGRQIIVDYNKLEFTRFKY